MANDIKIQFYFTLVSSDNRDDLGYQNIQGNYIVNKSTIERIINENDESVKAGLLRELIPDKQAFISIVQQQIANEWSSTIQNYSEDDVTELIVLIKGFDAEDNSCNSEDFDEEIQNEMNEYKINIGEFHQGKWQWEPSFLNSSDLIKWQYRY